MKKRILAMVLAMMMIVPAAMTSCSESTQNAETTAGDTAAAPVAGEEVAEEINIEELSPAEQRALIPDNLPEMTFEGRSYIFAVEEAKAYEIISEELTGEATNDAVYDRNLRIEDRFDVKIEVIPTTNPYDNVKNVVTAGTYAYDVA
ncbi:MAG: hypothetical protein II333_12260 [Clostridia bacterium]|nr:hypothetical protein [Clostridia bacterium]